MSRLDFENATKLRQAVLGTEERADNSTGARCRIPAIALAKQSPEVVEVPQRTIEAAIVNLVHVMAQKERKSGSLGPVHDVSI